MMSNDEILYHWNYFCSLCTTLDETKIYLNHGTFNADGNNISNGHVFSYKFQQLLILTCVEFENIGKIIAQNNDPSFKMTDNIVKISEVVLNAYPQVVNIEIYSDYKQKWKPLENWKVIQYNNLQNTVNKKTEGIDWWKAYTEIKHNGYGKFHLATLSNVIEALASLNVLELILMQIETNDTWIATTHPCSYFGNDYISQPICDTRCLPGF